MFDLASGVMHMRTTEHVDTIDFRQLVCTSAPPRVGRQRVFDGGKHIVLARSGEYRDGCAPERITKFRDLMFQGDALRMRLGAERTLTATVLDSRTTNTREPVKSIQPSHKKSAEGDSRNSLELVRQTGWGPCLNK